VSPIFSLRQRDYSERERHNLYNMNIAREEED